MFYQLERLEIDRPFIAPIDWDSFAGSLSESVQALMTAFPTCFLDFNP